MPSASKTKGTRIEREIVDRHKALGAGSGSGPSLHAERVPLSGAAGGSYTGDVIITLPVQYEGRNCELALRAEVKARKDGGKFKTIERWLGDNDILFLRRDRQDPLVVMPWSTYKKLIKP